MPPDNLEKATSEWRDYAADVCSGEAFKLLCELFQNALADQRTRRIRLIGKRCDPEIFNTFLGFEIKALGKRILCPDMATARYLRIFAEIGLGEVEVPYDVTRTQEFLPDLERAYAALKTILDFFSDQLLTVKEQKQFRRSVYESLRHALAKPLTISGSTAPLTKQAQNPRKVKL
jgi:hypothetical protein